MEKVASLDQVTADGGFRVDLGGKKILLVRDGETIRAYSAVCPHAGAPLEEGAICNGRIVCPWHKGAFAVSDGALLEPPALEGLERYPVRVEDNDIFVGAEPDPLPETSRAQEDRTFVIVGAGAAGGAAAAALREFGFGGRILLIGREPGLPFDRTSLSKFVVAGEMKPEEAPLLRSEAFYAQQGIELIAGEVSRFEATRRDLTLTDGRKIAFDAALLAPGAKPNRLDIPGADKQGVHVLRTREDAAAILADVRPFARAVVLGGSFIGLEVASCLRTQKMEVTVVSPQDIPFAKPFGQRVGRSLRALHEAHSVRFEVGTKAVRLEGDARVAAIILEDGRRLVADLVVVGVGVRPATAFLHGVALRKDGGVTVDASLQASPGVYAAGDIAAFPMSPDGEAVRVEHWRVAEQHARVAAANMVGRRAVYDTPPFFWTYHFGKNFEYLGHAEKWDEERAVGDVENHDFVAFLLRGGQVAAVVACERSRLTARLSERMRAPLPVSEALEMAQETKEK